MIDINSYAARMTAWQSTEVCWTLGHLDQVLAEVSDRSEASQFVVDYAIFRSFE